MTKRRNVIVHIVEDPDAYIISFGGRPAAA
jgi:hypothetical protein